MDASESQRPPTADGSAKRSALWQLAAQQAAQACSQGWGALSPSTQQLAAVGECLYEFRREAEGKVLHINHRDQLVAIFVPAQLSVSVRVPATVSHRTELSALALPAASAGHPFSFERHSMWDVLWMFGLHSAQAPGLVPAHWPSGLLRLRRLPRVSPGLLSPAILQTMGEMLSGPIGFDALCERLRTPAGEVCQHLCALHLTRALSAA